MEIIGAVAPQRPWSEERNVECLRDIRAGIISIGGGIVFGICLALTALTFIVLGMSTLTSVQRVIAIVLTFSAWSYLINSATERLCLVDHTIVYSSFLGRKKIVPLIDLEAMLLIHQGFNLERGIETIEFRRRGDKTETIALGPCWQRHTLEAFLHSVEEALNDPELLEEVR